jgi:signal transduction histidine kinase
MGRRLSLFYFGAENLMARMLSQIWRGNLYRQILLVAALALFVAQTFNAVMLFKGERARSRLEAATLLVGRIASQADRQADRGRDWGFANHQSKQGEHRRVISLIVDDDAANVQNIKAHFILRDEFTEHAREYLGQQDYGLRDIAIGQGRIDALPEELKIGPMETRAAQPMRRGGADMPSEAMVLTARTANGKWLSAAAFVRPRDHGAILAMILQTLTLYIAVMIPLALVARRIVKPLERLTERVGRVGLAGDIEPLVAEGPSDIRNLVDSFNIMQARVSNLLSEKDVMLGAIGHDLKTPLAALRVRVESVDDDDEREKMAASIDEMVVILDDILMFARLGKSGEAKQSTDIGVLAESVLDEFDVPGVTVSFIPPDSRIVADIRPVLVRRALRNLIGNAIKHGGSAALSLSKQNGKLSVFVDDNGPGIPDQNIESMFVPFSRAERSRNRATGGTGLGLTISRAIARSHGGEVILENLAGGGLRAVLELFAEDITA